MCSARKSSKLVECSSFIASYSNLVVQYSIDLRRCLQLPCDDPSTSRPEPFKAGFGYLLVGLRFLVRIRHRNVRSLSLSVVMAPRVLQGVGEATSFVGD